MHGGDGRYTEGSPSPIDTSATEPLPLMSFTATAPDKTTCYEQTRRRIDALLEEQTDWVAAMATVACELHHSFDYFDWTGFYRPVGDRTLLVGPYQGPHGCLQIDFDRGVCGAAARTRETQMVPDVEQVSDYIACQSSTRSEIVVPVITPEEEILAVLDVDSDTLGAFDATDREHLEALCNGLGKRFGETPDGVA
jgi:L-methionine (R)-S-oxide reductase